MSLAACALALVLVVDVSRSIDAREFTLQQEGTAQALLTDRVSNAIINSEGVALSVVFFESQARIAVPWQILRTREDIIGFSAAIRAIPYPDSMYTNVYAGISMGLDLLDNPPCEPDTKLIDISADGEHNSGSEHTQQSLVVRALENNVRINTLPILTSEHDFINERLYDWYNDNFAIPTGGFSVRSNGFGDFARAITIKLSTEITMR